MNPKFTLEEARTLKALSKFPTFQKAAAAIGKTPSALVYTLELLEEKAGFEILDRSGYRTQLSPKGHLVLQGLEEILNAEASLQKVCAEIQTGWEPELKVIVDGVIPLKKTFEIFRKMKGLHQSPTRFQLEVEYMETVEQKFTETQADFMVSVFPPESENLKSIRLRPIRLLLVASPKLPVFQGQKRKKIFQLKELSEFPLITVRGSSPRLQMITAELESQSAIRLNDFYAKKDAILSGLGWGWLPSSMIENEIKKRELFKLPITGVKSDHELRPSLYYRSQVKLGRSALLFLKEVSLSSSFHTRYPQA